MVKEFWFDIIFLQISNYKHAKLKTIEQGNLSGHSNVTLSVPTINNKKIFWDLKSGLIHISELRS